MKIFFTMSALSLIVALAVGCGSTQKGMSVKAAPAEILAKIVIKPSHPVVELEKTIILTAFGYDKNGKEINFNPTWTMDDASQKLGKLSTDQGKLVMFSADRVGYAYIKVENGDINTKEKVKIVRFVSPK